MPATVPPIARTGTVLTPPPAWVPGSAIGYYDFVKGQYWRAGDPSGGLVVTASGPQYVLWSSGQVSLVQAGAVPRSDLGLQVWETSTNILTAPCDLTDAVWSAANMTAAHNQMGPDRVAGSASLITAGAANATIMQTVTYAAGNMQASALLRRVSGSGAVSMTVDGGATWTAVSIDPLGKWSRVWIGQQTLANPQFGLKLATSGDAVAVWTQLEPNLLGAYPTAPMPAGHASRSAVFAATVPLPALVAATIYVETANLGFTAGDALISVGQGKQGAIYVGDSSATVSVIGVGSPPTPSVSATAGSGNIATGVVKRVAGFDANGMSLNVNGGGAGTNAVSLGALNNLLRIGGTAACDGFIRKIIVWPVNLPAATKLAQSVP